MDPKNIWLYLEWCICNVGFNLVQMNIHGPWRKADAKTGWNKNNIERQKSALTKKDKSQP